MSAEAKFSAAHTLPNVTQCDQLHGHLWRVRVTVKFAEASLGDGAMALDLRDLESLAQASVADFEHRYLNDLAPFHEYPPTSERIAQVVAGRVAAQLRTIAPAASLDEVAVWEMPEYRVVYRPA